MALGFIGWLEMLPWSLHGAAVAILALGLAGQAARLAARHAERLLRRLRRVTALLTGVTLLLGVASAVRSLGFQTRRPARPTYCSSSWIRCARRA